MTSRSREPVSYTHLDVYKRQVLTHLCGGSAGREGAALQMGGTIGQCMGRTFRLDDRDLMNY